MITYVLLLCFKQGSNLRLRKPDIIFVTVEGIFQAMDEIPRYELACFLAGEIRECVKQRLRGRNGRNDPAVAIINMRGEILGTGGDLRPWTQT